MILDCKKYLGECACGRDHELRTKLVVCEYGALKNFDKYMDDCGLTGFRTVIYDTNTYNLPTMTHVAADQEIVLEAKGLHSEKGLIEDCMTRFVRKPDYVVVVGGGTLMDFGRYSAWRLGIPFVAIPTIVSSDGFTADICSIIIDGQKKSIPMQAADADDRGRAGHHGQVRLHRRLEDRPSRRGRVLLRQGLRHGAGGAGHHGALRA